MLLILINLVSLCPNLNDDDPKIVVSQLKLLCIPLKVCIYIYYIYIYIYIYMHIHSGEKPCDVK